MGWISLLENYPPYINRQGRYHLLPPRLSRVSPATAQDYPPFPERFGERGFFSINFYSSITRNPTRTEWAGFLCLGKHPPYINRQGREASATAHVYPPFPERFGERGFFSIDSYFSITRNPARPEWAEFLCLGEHPSYIKS